MPAVDWKACAEAAPSPVTPWSAVKPAGTLIAPSLMLSRPVRMRSPLVTVVMPGDVGLLDELLLLAPAGTSRPVLPETHHS